MVGRHLGGDNGWVAAASAGLLGGAGRDDSGKQCCGGRRSRNHEQLTES